MNHLIPIANRTFHNIWPRFPFVNVNITYRLSHEQPVLEDPDALQTVFFNSSIFCSWMINPLRTWILCRALLITMSCRVWSQCSPLQQLMACFPFSGKPALLHQHFDSTFFLVFISIICLWIRFILCFLDDLHRLRAAVRRYSRFLPDVVPTTPCLKCQSSGTTKTSYLLTQARNEWQWALPLPPVYLLSSLLFRQEILVLLSLLHSRSPKSKIKCPIFLSRALSDSKWNYSGWASK